MKVVMNVKIRCIVEKGDQSNVHKLNFTTGTGGWPGM